MENGSESSSYYYSLVDAFTHPIYYEVIISLIVWSMDFLAIFGNILVFIAVLRDKKLRDNIGNIYILNLASSDLCVGLNSILICNIWRYYGNWPFQKGMCIFWIIMDYAACTQSAFAIVLISMDRYLLVTKYLKYRKYQSKAIAGALIATTWSISVLFYALPILGDKLWKTNDYGPIDYTITCDIGALFILSYTIAQIVFSFGIPAVVLAYLNAMVYLNILKRSKGLVRTSVEPSVKTNTEGSSVPDPYIVSTIEPANVSKTTDVERAEKKTYRKHRKAAITLAIIVGMFSLSWIPYYVVQLLYLPGEVSFSWLLWNGVYYTVWVNSAINPFIYAATSPKMRRGFTEVLCFWNKRFLRKVRPM